MTEQEKTLSGLVALGYICGAVVVGLPVLVFGVSGWAAFFALLGTVAAMMKLVKTASDLAEVYYDLTEVTE